MRLGHHRNSCDLPAKKSSDPLGGPRMIDQGRTRRKAGLEIDMNDDRGAGLLCHRVANCWGVPG